MDTLVVFGLLVLAGATVVGAIIAFFAFRRAQHGFEDHEGFHRDRRPKRRDKR